MDPPTVAPKPPRYNTSQHNPVFSATGLEQSPLHFGSFSQSINPNYEDLSFSSYIKPKENEDPEISIFDAQKYFDENNTNRIHSNSSSNLKSSNSIKIQQNQDPAGPRLSSVSSDGNGRNFRTRSFHATPTASSEASWNSQTGLLVNPPGSKTVSMKNFASDDKNSNLQRGNSGKKWIFGRTCCCTGKKSVGVKEATTMTVSGPVESKKGPRIKSDSHKASDRHRVVDIRKIPPMKARVVSSQESDFAGADTPRQQRISASGRPFVDGAGGFSFPILKNPTQTVRPGPRGIRPLEEEPPRDSLEVFQPAENKLAGGGSRQHFNPGSPIVRVVSTDDDLGSDASSDLFELESFSTQTTSSYPMYRRSDSLDEAPILNARRIASAAALSEQYDRKSQDEPPTTSVTATECYAPSKVSIDWSVTTPEGIDRASVSSFSTAASEASSEAFLRKKVQEEAGGGDGGRRKRNSGGMLMMSCRQGKAVSVGPQPVRRLPAGAGEEGRGTPADGK